VPVWVQAMELELELEPQRESEQAQVRDWVQGLPGPVQEPASPLGPRRVPAREPG
jgi:hypothetical protein